MLDWVDEGVAVDWAAASFAAAFLSARSSLAFTSGDSSASTSFQILVILLSRNAVYIIFVPKANRRVVKGRVLLKCRGRRILNRMDGSKICAVKGTKIKILGKIYSKQLTQDFLLNNIINY